MNTDSIEPGVMPDPVPWFVEIGSRLILAIARDYEIANARQLGKNSQCRCVEDYCLFPRL